MDPAPIDFAGVSPAKLIEWLRTMVLIRTFEHESVRLSLAGKIPGGIHSSEGQEAVAVGSIRALGFPITPYETQWAEPVEVVRDRWLGVFADIVTRTWERMEEES